MSERACRPTHAARFVLATALAWWETGRDDMLGEVEIAVRELDRDEAQRDELTAVLNAL